ncbi:hypothetical protein CBR_g58695 [Chara braunii]|uniref:CCHC-type domain-containing protein n=1 Tax=Chara braunii TaxID=69332 RepID=A0A388MES8_CHABU|nr:hypothetical protein CBR_g58695 [Chara braunii]|eukprot:GBG93076.1 hypothetical protein CBR_g58695 [Chara braunii]
MGDRKYRELSRDYRENNERGRDSRRDDAWLRHRGRSQDDYRHDRSERSYGSGDYGRRGPPTCYNFGEVGHYKNQCWKRSEEAVSKGGASTSSVPRPVTQVDDEVKKTVEGHASSVACFKEYIDKENMKKENKERKKREKEERARKEEEEWMAKEAERAAKEERAAQKMAKKKKEEEEKLEFTKSVRMHVAMCMGGLQEQVQDQMRRNMEEFQRILKGKQVVSPSGSVGSHTSDRVASEVEELSHKAERLVITEKRKRSHDGPVGNSPPVTQTPKKTPRKTGVKPVKLATKLQATVGRTAKKTTTQVETKKTPTRYTPKKDTPKTKIAAKMGSAGRVKFIGENMRELAEYHADDLKKVCRRDDVEYGNKVTAMINIVEK